MGPRRILGRAGLTIAVAVIASAPAAVAQAANGPVAFGSGGNLVLQPLTGAPRVVPGRAAQIVGSSRSGKLLAYSSGVDGDVTITDPRGKVLRSFNAGGLTVHSLDISPDGGRVALTAFRDAEPVPGRVYPYVARIDGRDLRRLKTQLRYTYDIRFTRDGGSIVYAGVPSTGDFARCASLRRVRLDGTGEKWLYQATGGVTPCVVGFGLSPGGSTAAFVGDPGPGAQSRAALYRVALTGSATPQLLRPAAFAVAWAPTGDQLAYSTPAGTFRVSQFGGPDTLVSSAPTLSLTWLKAGG